MTAIKRRSQSGIGDGARYISYLRVSTERQGRSGLGLEAQRQTVADRLSPDDRLITEFVEIESGRRSDRPQLEQALLACRVHNAALIVAKLDRLSRNTHFLLTLLEAGVEPIFCDLPDTTGPIGRFLLTQMAAVAELEAGLISKRTKDALQAAKARGVKLGGWRGVSVDTAPARARAGAARARYADRWASDLSGEIERARGAGAGNLSAIAEHLNGKGIATRRGAQWDATTVRRVLARLAE